MSCNCGAGVGTYSCTCTLQTISILVPSPTNLTVGAGQGGARGLQGPQGIQGVDGAYAAQGIQGTQGTDGTQGIQGDIGLGYDGITSNTALNLSVIGVGYGVGLVVNKIGALAVGSRIRVASTNISFAAHAWYDGVINQIYPDYPSLEFQITNVSPDIQTVAGSDLVVAAGGVLDSWNVSIVGAQGAQGVDGAYAAQGVQGTQGASGYNPVTISNTYYVAKNGDDSNNGQNQDTPFLTIKHAMSVAISGTAVHVASGTYTEQNPITIPAGVSLVGDSLRTVKISGTTHDADIFYVNNSVYITEVTFINHVAPAAAVAFNPDGSAGAIYSSPYVYNCSSVTTTGTGMRIDGSKVTGGRSMVSGQYTQVNRGGKGIHVLNRGYSQLVGIYTIFTDIGILCESGGFCSLIGSDTSFGNYGLKASGVSELLYSGIAPDIAANDNVAVISGLSSTPYANNVVTFDNGANYYTISNVTPISSGHSTLTFAERIKTPVSSGATAKFYQNSRITASGHTFEYCGTGIDPATALPQLGGIPIEANEVVEENGGKVYYTSTDQRGNFKIGSDLTIDRGLGTITGITFDKSLFAVMTPYILALEG